MKEKTKKNLLVVAAVVLVAALLSACGSSLNANNTRTAKSIINTVDLYLDGKIDAGTAHDLIEAEYDAIDDSDENSTNRLIFSTHVLSISIELSSMAFNGGGDVAEIEDSRNEIASLIGVGKY